MLVDLRAFVGTAPEPRCTVQRLIDEFRLMASWLGLPSLVVAPAAVIDPLLASIE
jgi:hypothetical protein